MRSTTGDVVASLDRLAGEDVTAWTDDEVRDSLLTLLPCVNQLCAVVSLLVASFDLRDLSGVDACKTVRSWLIAHGRMSQGAATGWVLRGRLLRQLPALAAGALDGAVSAEHVRKVQDLVDHIGLDAVREHDETLAWLSGEANPADTEAACQRIRAHVDPDGPEPDPKAAERRGLTVTRVGSLFRIAGLVDAEGGEILLTALNALMGPPTPGDERTAFQRRCDALVELGRRALIEGDLPVVGGVRPQVGILITPQALVGADPTEQPLPDDALGRAGIPLPPPTPCGSWKSQLPPEVVQRISCDCEVWRIVLDPATGLPLEVGRTHRIVPTWLRKALHARDQGCRWTGCTTPAQWCEVHHLVPWYYGGITAVENCTLLCRYHHGLVHHERPADRRWRIELDPTTATVTIYRPDGTPYELGPTRPHRGPAPHRGPTHTTAAVA